MGEPFPGTPPSARPPEDRLDSWKEIAAYLNRDVTTVQRWEKREGMPVHRHLHDRMGSVYAFSDRPGRVGAQSESPSSAGGRDDRALAPVPAAPAAALGDIDLSSPMEVRLAAGRGRSGAGDWRRASGFKGRSSSGEAPSLTRDFRSVTDFDGVEQAAAVSRDGHFVAFLSDRDGQTDVWVTQVGSGQFHNLTRGSAPELVNPSVRTLGFSPDGSFVTFWVRKQDGSSGGDIGIWAVPTLGGQPRPYLEGVAEFDWSHDGSRLAYHTPGPGDPLFVSDGSRRPRRAGPSSPRLPGSTAHFPLWAPDAAFIYFVQGSLPDKLDIWRITSRRRDPGTDHVAQWARESSGPVGSADADVPRHRSRWFGAVAS